MKRNVDNIFNGLTIRQGDRVRNRGRSYRLVPMDDRAWTPPEPAMAPTDPFGVPNHGLGPRP